MIPAKLSGPVRNASATTLLVLWLLAGNLFPLPGQADQVLTAGWIEHARLEPLGIELEAKLDTGAQSSSLHAPHLERVNRNGEEQVRFTVEIGDGHPIELVLPVIREVAIKRHGGALQRRPVVRLGICIGRVLKYAEVNLVDRSGFDYPLLVGRSFLAGDFLIDPGKTRMLEPHCEVPTTRPLPDVPMGID